MLWYAVRCVFRHRPVGGYQERITLWRAASFDDAIGQAEAEAAEYPAEYIGLAQVYALSDDPAASGAEVFSLIRRSKLTPDAYLDRFFDTGAEFQGGPLR